MKKIILIVCFSLANFILTAQSIDQKYQQLGGAAKLGNPTGKEGVTFDKKGKYKEYNLNGIVSLLVQQNSTSPAFLLQGEILKKWQLLKGESGVLGYPTKDQAIIELDGTEAAEFGGRGTIYWRKNAAACVVKGDIINKWKTSGYINTYGWPLTDEIGIPIYGVGQVFEKASMVWKATDRSIFILTGNEFNTWKAGGAQNGARGWALSKQAGTAGELVYEKNGAATTATTTPRKRVRVSSPNKTMVKSNILDVIKKTNSVLKTLAPYSFKKNIDGIEVEITVPNPTDNTDGMSVKSDPQNRKVSKENEKFCDSYEVQYYNVSEEQQALNDGMSIYPGGIYRLADLANGTRSAMASQFISKRKPVQLYVPTSTNGGSISIPNSDVNINDPSQITELNRGIDFFLKQKPLSSNAGQIRASFSEKETSEEAKITANAYFGGWGATLNSQFKSSSIKQYKNTVIEFIQPYFSINVDETSLGDDIRTNKNAWFKTPQTLSKDLVFVSSCTYGRRGYLFVESSYSSEEIETAVNASYSGFVDAKGHIDYKSKNIMNSLNVKGVIMGGNAVGGAKAVLNIEEFKKFISASAEYGPNNMPVLLSYNLAFLDGQTAKVVTTANQTVQKCRPLNPTIEITLNYIHTDGYPVSAYVEVAPCKEINRKGVFIGDKKQLCNVSQISGNYIGQAPGPMLKPSIGNPISKCTFSFTNEDIENNAYINIFYKIEKGSPMTLLQGEQTNRLYIKDLLSKPDFFYDQLMDASGKNVNIGWTISFK